jgi:hypothetical protein
MRSARNERDLREKQVSEAIRKSIGGTKHPDATGDFQTCFLYDGHAHHHDGRPDMAL